MVKYDVWHRIRWGAYTFEDIWASADARERHRITCRAVVRAARAPVVLSHTSAVLEYTDTFWGLDLADVHVTRLDGRTGRAEAGVRQHRGIVMPGDVSGSGELPVMSPDRAALELTTVTDTESALVSINAMLNTGVVDLEDMLRRYESMVTWPHSLKTGLVLRRADGRLESAGESRSDHLFWFQDLPRPIPQFPIHDASGRLVARLDFAWPALRVWVEFDGVGKYTKHLRPGETTSDAVMREKRREDLVRELTGWICIRITWADLQHPARTAARIRAAFAQQRAA
ncbi:hypothetical protein EKO23_18385 [Nocardioides guangzhouensis]|uniref:DUF559 domain-containing protein n=2 Tax=Nocardioides guangzhouensis TaxID=2497878 RepID=A0A4Q4Z955_9ACTN|nr:hypothetical protein EKO23_18385 [Nocardioides guangzhouensis]